MIDFEQARLIAIQGTASYLNGDRPLDTGDRYGQHQGVMGVNRAQHLGMFLTDPALAQPTENRDANLLALFLAIFTNKVNDNGFFSFFKNPFRNIGRSSKLASYIADRWIDGNITYGVGNEPGSVTSAIFPQVLLNQAVSNRSNFRVVPNGDSGFSYFDKTKAVRRMLKTILNSPEFEKDKAAIIESASKLRDYLESGDMRFNGSTQLLLPFPNETIKQIFGRRRL